MAVISDRRGPVIGVELAALGPGARARRGPDVRRRGARRGPGSRAWRSSTCRWCCWLARRSSRGSAPEMLLVMLGAPALAGLTLALLGGYRALAAASALTVLAYALDVIAGSPLDGALADRAPIPGWGSASTGSATSSRRCWRCWSSPAPGRGWPGSRRDCRRAASARRLPCGRPRCRLRLRGRALRRRRRRRDRDSRRRRRCRGGDRGSQAQARRCSSSRRRSPPSPCLPSSTCSPAPTPTSPARCSTPVACSDLGDVAEAPPAASPRTASLTPAPLRLPALGRPARRARGGARDRLARLARSAPAMRAGLIGAVVATVVGALANDSGALMLEIGAAYLLVFARLRLG